MMNTQDIQYHEVKYIIDKTYEQRDIVREKIRACRVYKAALKLAQANVKRSEVKKAYQLYRVYQKQMCAMYDAYLGKINDGKNSSASFGDVRKLQSIAG